MSVSIRLNDSELAAIEDEYDLQAFKKAKEEFEENPVTYTLDEVIAELNSDSK